MKVCPPTSSSTTRSLEAGPPRKTEAPTVQVRNRITRAVRPGISPSAPRCAATPATNATVARSSARNHRSTVPADWFTPSSMTDGPVIVLTSPEAAADTERQPPPLQDAVATLRNTGELHG